MGKRMKVKVTVTVEVDRDEWADAYGLENSASSVREDVKSYVANGVAGAGDAPITVLNWE